MYRQRPHSIGFWSSIMAVAICLTPAVAAGITDPALPTCINTPSYDVLHGEIVIDNSSVSGTPGQYRSRVRLHGTVTGTIGRFTLQFVQLRVRGCEDAVVAASVALPAPPKPFTSVTVPLQVSLESGLCTSEKLVELWAVSENVSNPLWAEKLGEVLLHTPDPHGTLKALTPTCVRGQDDSPCDVTLAYESTNLQGQFTRLFLLAGAGCEGVPGEPEEGGYVLAEFPINSAGQITTAAVNCSIGALTVDYSLIAFPTGQPFSPRPSAFKIRLNGRQLGSASVTSVPANGIVCPVDGLPMRKNPVDPEDFIGVITNGSTGGINEQPSLNLAGSILSDAGMRVFRQTVDWSIVEANMGVHDFTRPDRILSAFSSHGLEPWLTLSRTPGWAGVAPPQPSSCPQGAGAYPVAPEHMDEWREFVRATALRYGPGGVLPIPCKNWEIWQEPDVGFFCGTIQQWGELFTAAREEIKAIDPTANVWAPNVVIVYQRFASEVVPWLDYAINSLEVDGICIHPFFSSNPVHLAQMYQSIRYVRKRLDDRFGVGVIPLAVTATAYGAEGDLWGFVRNLTPQQQEQYLVDCYSIIANAGADRAMWFNAIDRSACCPSPNANICALRGLGFLQPPPDLMNPVLAPNPHLSGVTRLHDWLSE